MKEIPSLMTPHKATSEIFAAVQPDPVYAHHQLLICFQKIISRTSSKTEK